MGRRLWNGIGGLGWGMGTYTRYCGFCKLLVVHSIICSSIVSSHDRQPLIHATPFKQSKTPQPIAPLPPHAYKTADEAYRAMMRGIENEVLTTPHRSRSSSTVRGGRKSQNVNVVAKSMPTNQSILVSGESGAGKTVTTKIVLNYFAMLSKKVRIQHYNIVSWRI